MLEIAINLLQYRNVQQEINVTLKAAINNSR